MRQGRRASIVGSALIVASLLFLAPFLAPASDALAQARNNQPPARQRAPELPPSGHQTEAVDLNEGRSAAELFKAGCAVCHQSAAGLAKGRRDSELVGFLRQHYTSGTQHAAVLAGFLTSAGAGGRGGPAAAATPARLNPNAPIDRPPAPVGREEEGRKPQEAARPPQDREPREPAAKRKPPERPPVAARPAPQPAQPAAPAAPSTEAAAHQGEAPAASAPLPPAEEKPAPPEIPL